jgi:hypothetical protein
MDQGAVEVNNQGIRQNSLSNNKIQSRCALPHMGHAWHSPPSETMQFGALN